MVYYQKKEESRWHEIPIRVEHFAEPTNTPVNVTEMYGTYKLINLDAESVYKIFVTSANSYGMSDPSNVIWAKTQSSNSVIFLNFYHDLFLI